MFTRTGEETDRTYLILLMTSLYSSKGETVMLLLSQNSTRFRSTTNLKNCEDQTNFTDNRLKHCSYWLFMFTIWCFLASFTSCSQTFPVWFSLSCFLINPQCACTLPAQKTDAFVVIIHSKWLQFRTWVEVCKKWL